MHESQAAQIADRVADLGVAISAGGATVAWLGLAGEVVQLIAGCVAVISGSAAGWYYIAKHRRAVRDDNEARAVKEARAEKNPRRR